MAYDIIGDIHGQADQLEALLTRLGYAKSSGTYRHPGRQVIFVGDFIDRGPRQIDTVMTVRRMVESGTALAVMGNHEFNAIAWHTPDPEQPGEYLRPHQGKIGEKNHIQHSAFLREVQDKPELHLEIVNWFLTLPLWLDLPGLRVVHACWHEGYMEELRPHLNADLTLSRELMIPASRKGHMAFRTVEGLTKGLEVQLPDGHSFRDKDGYERRNVRIRWWEPAGSTYRELALMPEEEREKLPAVPLKQDSRSPCDPSKPVFFGHYWMSGELMLQTPYAACVDYSAAKGGPLVAYRWDGESTLDAGRFVCAHQ